MPRHLLGASFRAETKFHIVNCQFLWTFQKCSCFTFQRLKGPKQQLSPPPPLTCSEIKGEKKKKKNCLVGSVPDWFVRVHGSNSAFHRSVLSIYFFFSTLLNSFKFSDSLCHNEKKRGGGGNLYNGINQKCWTSFFSENRKTQVKFRIRISWFYRLPPFCMETSALPVMPPSRCFFFSLYIALIKAKVISYGHRLL